LLAAITALLRARQLLKVDEEPGYNITVISEHLIHISAYADSGAQFHIKVKECGRWPNEYANYCDAERIYPQCIPEVLAREFRNDREVIVFRGIPHRRIPAGSITRSGRRLRGEIVRFFQTSGKAALVIEPVAPHRVFLRHLQERITDGICATIVRDWTESVHLAALPFIRQHGDLVLNNLGLTGAGLVVFDWEDFGLIVLPGLDLCTLLASDTEFNSVKLLAIMNGHHNPSDSFAVLLDQSCKAIGLTPELFRQLIPLYLVIFLDLKREYGLAIADTVRNLIHEIAKR